MQIKVYADKKSRGNSVGIRDDGAVTVCYGQDERAWRETHVLYAWMSGPLADAIAARDADTEAGPLFTIDAED